jgi:cold-inducible RNA-binding protein
VNLQNITNMSNNKLFVGNLPFDTTENDLHTTFGSHGTVVEAKLMTDRESGRPRGFAFVTMGTSEEAQSAINALNGHTVEGRALTVNVAKPREDRGGGGRGFGGGNGGGRREFSGARNRY